MGPAHRSWFGSRAAVIVAVAALPILWTRNVVVARRVVGGFRVAIPGALLFAADGWIATGYVFVWQIALTEPTAEAEEAWVAHVNEVAHRTLYPKAASWYMGANIPGKPRVFLPYIGGGGADRRKFDEVAGTGEEGFVMAPGGSMGREKKVGVPQKAPR